MLQRPAGGKRGAAVKNADVIQAQEAAFKNIGPFGVLAVHPPGKVHEQLVKHPLQETHIRLALEPLIDLEHAPGRPGVDRRIHIAERPLICGNLPVRMHIPFPQE